MDPIFYLSDKTDEIREILDDDSLCACCDSQSKLKNCEFCGKIVCSKHLDNQRPYPANNPDRQNLSTQVCLICQSKFLYREALFEMHRTFEILEIEQDISKQQLAVATESFDKIVRKQIKQAQSKVDTQQDLILDRDDYVEIRQEVLEEIEVAKVEYAATQQALDETKASVSALFDEHRRLVA